MVLLAAAAAAVGCGGAASQVSPVAPPSSTPSPAAPTASVTAAPTTVTYGQNSATVSWQTQNATSVTLNGAAVAATGTQTVTNLTQTTTYTVMATGAGGQQQASATVSVAPAVSLSANPTTIVAGGSSALTWAAQGAQTVTLNPGASQLTGAGGTVTVTPTQTTTYTLIATGAGGVQQQATATITVSAAPPPTVSLNASPATIASGGTSTLTWSSQNAQTLLLTPGNAQLTGSSGTMAVNPTQTTTYTLAATGPGGTQQATATVTVAPAPTATFTAAPATIDAGQSSVLSWQTTNATSVVLDTLTVADNGSMTVSPTHSAWYKLVATGPGGSVTQNVQVVVNVPPGSISSHVAVIVMENQNYGNVIGSSSAPYLNSLAKKYALASNYYANSIGFSQPDYFMLTVGELVFNGDNTTIIVTADNVVRELKKAGKTWKAYAEDLPAHYLPTDPSYTCTSGEYVCIHNPFVFLCDVNGASSCPVPYDSAEAKNVVPYSQLATDISNGTLPDYIFVIPNNCHNTHDCSLSTGDSWLQANVPPLLNSIGGNGFVVVTFDESSNSSTNGGGKVATVIAGPTVKPGYDSTTFYQHQSTLRLMMKALGVFSYPNAAATAPDMDEFFTAALP